MAGKKLEVGIGADVSDFKKKISEVEFDLKELSKLKIERIKLGLDTSEINRNITDVKKTLRDLKSTTTDAGNSFGAFNKKTADGGAALTSFSRIAQDAPYGIIGVGNNITNTAEQFGALVKQTGSAGGALKALLSSLSGVGGVLLGVSLLTTGLTLLSQSGLTVSDVLDKLTGQYDEFKESINKIRVETAKQSGEEIANMKALVSVAQDETLSREKRLIAVKELQKEFPAYFGNLNTEKILNGNLTSTVQELTKAIIARAEASAIADEIGKLASKKLDLQIQKEKAILKLKEAQSASENKVTVTGGTLGATGLSEVGQLASATSRVKDLNQQIYDIQVLQDKLAGRLNQKKKEDILLSQEQVKIQKTKTFNTPQVSKANTGISGGGLIDLTQLEFTTGKLDKLGNKLKELPGTISTAFTGIKEITGKGFTDLELASIDFVNNFNSIVQNLAETGLANLGTNIGAALATGNDVLQAAGQSILQTFSSFLSQLGDQLIKLGLAAVLTGTVLKSIGTISGVGAGLAAIAGGVALKAIAGGINASAQRGIGGGGGFSTRGGSNSSFSSSSGRFSRWRIKWKCSI
jgi:predicted PurR-regulated permease PerM